MDLSPRPDYKLPNSSPFCLKHDTGFLKPFQPVSRPSWLYLFAFVIVAIFTFVFVQMSLMMGLHVVYGFGAAALFASLIALWLHGNFVGSVIDILLDIPSLLSMTLSQRWREFIMTMGLFTRLPLPEFEEKSPLDVELIKPLNAAWAYPFVGFIIGVLSASVILLCSFLSIPTTLSAILALLVSVILTGSLHEDGLSDFLDGIGGGKNKEEKLRIMKDSHLGSYGGIAMLFSLAARGAAIASLAPMTAAAAVIAAHTIARGSLVLPLHWYPPAKPDGVAVAATGWVSGAITAFVLVSTLLLTLIVMPSPATTLIAWLAGSLVIILTARYAYNRVGGYTGDVLGACEQFAEIAVLWYIAAFLVQNAV